MAFAAFVGSFELPGIGKDFVQFIRIDFQQIKKMPHDVHNSKRGKKMTNDESKTLKVSCLQLIIYHVIT